MRRSLLLALVLCLFVIPAAAQTDPAPLTAEDIFAPNVEIRYVTPDEPQPDFAADDELRVMSLGGRVIPYPEGFERVFRIEQIDSDTFFIDNLITASTDEYQHKYWLYNTNTDTLIETTGECEGNPPYLYQSLAELPWTVFPEGDGFTLCHYFTGERILLPTDRAIFDYFPWEGYGDEGILEMSPDRQFLLISGREWFGSGGGKPSSFDVLYSYEFATKTFRELGMFSGYSWPGIFVDRWLSPTEFTLSDNDSLTDSEKIYTGDALQENSLTEFASGSYLLSYADNPPRYIEENTDGLGDFMCGKAVFDLSTREVFRYPDLGWALCRPEYGTFEGVGYYREVPAGEMPQCCTPRSVEIAEVPVVRYDSQTGEYQELYRGEVEQIRWVSDDDRYAILLLDDNGVISDFPYLDPFYDGEYGYAHWALVDLESDEILHTVPNNYLAFQNNYYSYDRSAEHLGIYPLADGSFVTNTCHVAATLCDSELSEHVVITGNGIHRETLDYNPVVPLSGQNRVFINPDPANPRAGRDLYDVVTGEVIPFIKPLETDSYRLYVGIRETGEVYATLGAQSSELQDIHFAISFDEDGTPIVTVKEPAVPFEFDVAAATPVVAISATPSMTYTPSLTPTRTPTSDPTCYLTVINDANLRNFPDADPESESIVVGSAAVGFQLTAVGKHENPRDEFIWWKLSTGEWLREDFVDERGPCFVLRSIAPDSFDYIFITPTPTVPPTLTPTRTPTVTPTPVPACEMTVIIGANLRSEPDAGSAQVGSVAEGFELTAVGQFANPEDFFTWWKLDSGEWLREDFVDEQETCTHLAFVDASAPDFVFVTPTPSSTPTITATVTARATATPDLSASCTLTVVNGANLRAGPAVETEKVGSAAVDFVLTAVGQAENTQDFFTWWQLDTGEWIREDFVREGEGCDALPNVQS